MLLPIIHTLVTSPPPIGVTTNTKVALGIFFASKDIYKKNAGSIGYLIEQVAISLVIYLILY